MRQLDVDWDEAVRYAFQRVLRVSDWQALKHGRLFRKWIAEDEI